MSEILIYGNNQISRYLHDSFSNRGISTTDITDKVDNPSWLSEQKRASADQIQAIIDISNAKLTLSTHEDLIHNTAGIKDLLDIAKAKKSPFIFLYREGYDLTPESPLFIGIDFIKEYSQEINIPSARIQIEDIYGPDINTSKTLQSFIDSIIEGTSLIVNDDTSEHYLMHQKDFSDGLLSIIEETETTGTQKFYTLYPEDSITEIELANFFKELSDLNLEIEYMADDAPSQNLAESEVSYPENWYPEIDLETGLTDLFDYYDIPTQDDDYEELQANLEEEPNLLDENDDGSIDEYDDDYEMDAEPAPAYVDSYTDLLGMSANATKQPEKKARETSAQTKKRIATLVSLLVFSLMLPSLLYITTSVAGNSFVSKAAAAMQNYNFEEAHSKSKGAMKLLGVSKSTPAPVKLVYKIRGINNKDLFLINETSRKTAELLYNLSKVEIDSEVADAGTENFPTVLGVSTAVDTNLERSIELASEIEKYIAAIETENKSVRKNLAKTELAINENKDLIIKLNNVDTALPIFLGLKSPQKYLLVVQDTDEIRATGGKIESYAILEMGNGRVIMNGLNSARYIDGQINLNDIKTTPPESLVTALNYDRFYFSDSNWDPDFRNAAKTIAEIYEKAAGDEIDGVIAVNKSFFTENLGAADLSVNTSQLSPQTINAVLAGLNSKDILLYHKNSAVLSGFLKNDWAGGIKSDNADDFVYVVDTNISANKSNNTVDKSIKYSAKELSLSNNFSRKLEITYSNTGSSDSGSRSNFLNHLRIIIPKNTALNRVTMETMDSTVNITRSIDVSSYQGFALLETDLLIPSGEVVTVTFAYESAPAIFQDGVFDIKFQKQPGAKTVQVEIDMEGLDNKSIQLAEDTIVPFPL